VRIVFADDHNLIRESIIPYLMRLADKVEILQASNVAEAEKHLRSGPADLVILDLQMPGMTNLDGIDAIKRVSKSARIAILSGFYDKRTITLALEKGVNGFIPKTTTGNSLLNALRIILDGETFVPSAVMDDDGPSLFGQDQRPTEIDKDGKLGHLTEREIEILKDLVVGKTNKEIANKLSLQEITIKVHMRNIYRKIGADNRADAVRISMEAGLKY
jgi:two-component system, NarL family, nitrate/nitrite response regulator NarL